MDGVSRGGVERGRREEVFLRIEELTNIMATTEQKYTEPYMSEVMKELGRYLDQAAIATRHEPAANKRVAFLRSGLEYTDAYIAAFRIFRAHETNNPGGGRLPNETKQRIRAALDNNWLDSRDVFKHNHLAVNVATVAWGSWSYFGPYYWSEPSPEVREKTVESEE